MASRQVVVNWEHFRDFHQWVKERAQNGLASDRTEAKYVPDWAQRDYWSSGRIGEIFASRNLFVQNGVTQNGYIRVLSTLVYITRAELPAIEYMDEIISCSRNDATLPWPEDHRHEIFNSREGTKVYDEFLAAQWQFCPIPTEAFMPSESTMSNRKLDIRQIFPISKHPTIEPDPHRATRSVDLYYMNIHSPPNTQRQSQRTTLGQAPTTVVFKTYPSIEQQSYEDERKTYTASQNATNHDNILHCLGSHYYLSPERERISSIMLEFADFGTLRDVFLRNRPPYRFDDIRAFWRGFLGAIYGLETLHNLNLSEGYRSVHQDLKPSNIFIFRGNPDAGPFAYKFKIGDFGSSYAQSADPAFHGQSGPDRGATREYGPPELHLNDSIDYRVTSVVDMWAIGCIMLETAMWITGGELARQDFRRDRMDETDGLPDHKRLGRSDCFHDGNSALKCVAAVRQTVKAYRRVHDSITPAIVDLALDYALIDARERILARQLVGRISKVLNPSSGRVTNGLVLQSPASLPATPPFVKQGPWQVNSPISIDQERDSPEVYDWSHRPSTGPGLNQMSHLSSPSSSPSGYTTSAVIPGVVPGGAQAQLSVASGPARSNSPADSVMISSLPAVTITKLRGWMKEKKDHRHTDLPGWKAAKQLLAGRDFFIVVDNSRHMQGHARAVKEGVTALTYLIKDLDRNGIDFINTSAPQNKKSFKNSSHAGTFVDTTFTQGSGADCMIERALNAIFDPLKDSWSENRHGSMLFNSRAFTSSASAGQGQGVSILVFTNGLWDHSPGGTSGADRPIQNLINKMKAQDISKTQVSIQFVRLGDEARGKRRLEILDDELPQRPGNEHYDIVDHKHITSSVWEILIVNSYFVALKAIYARALQLRYTDPAIYVGFSRNGDKRHQIYIRFAALYQEIQNFCNDSESHDCGNGTNIWKDRDGRPTLENQTIVPSPCYIKLQYLVRHDAALKAQFLLPVEPHRHGESQDRQIVRNHILFFTDEVVDIHFPTGTGAKLDFPTEKKQSESSQKPKWTTSSTMYSTSEPGNILRNSTKI
ncbi:putative Kinase-like domain-containing protein [Seiridium cardinale]